MLKSECEGRAGGSPRPFAIREAGWMNLFEKAINFVFGTKHERDAKRMRPIVEAINAREAEIEGLDDEALRGRFEAIGERVRAATAELPDDRRERSVLVQGVLDPELEEERPGPGRPRSRARGGLRSGPRGEQTGHRNASLRRSVGGWRCTPRRSHRRDADRRGQNVGGDPAGGAERTHRSWGSPGDGQ